MRPLREITGDSLFNQVFLDEVFVPDDCVVGEVNGGWRVARTTLANERVSLSQSWTFGSGVPELLKVARPRAGAGRRRSSGAGALVCEGHAIDLLGLRVTLKQLSGTEPGATGSVRKLLGMRHAQQIAELCWRCPARTALGGGGAPSAGPVRTGPAGADDPGAHDRRRHHRHPAEHHRRADTRPAPRPGAAPRSAPRRPAHGCPPTPAVVGWHPAVWQRDGRA